MSPPTPTPYSGSGPQDFSDPQESAFSSPGTGNRRSLTHTISIHAKGRIRCGPPAVFRPGNARGRDLSDRGLAQGKRNLRRRSIAVVFGLVGSLLGNADIVGLLLRQARELHAEAGQMQPRHLLVEPLGKAVNTHFGSFSRHSSICARHWFVKEFDMTNDG